VDGPQPQRPLTPGETVRVVDLDGLELIVEPNKEEPS
jgi:membrane protein implicated in regulation of membrane protease activity